MWLTVDAHTEGIEERQICYQHGALWFNKVISSTDVV